ncbi:MAG: hypothetical protein GX455_15310 [Phycisphaerae bacterium]|nr:hypothetical protein [Phycisphaerae bacterium]
MGSRQFKILIVLLAAAALAAAFFLRPKRYLVDPTHYSLTRLEDPNGIPLCLKAFNNAGEMIAFREIRTWMLRRMDRVKYGQHHPDSWEAYRIDSRGQIHPIRLPKDCFVEPRAMNDSGTIVGTFCDPNRVDGARITVSVCDPNRVDAAFCWDLQWGFRKIPFESPLKCSLSHGEAINNNGWMAGSWFTKSPRSSRIFLYEPSAGFIDIGTPAGFIQIEDINEHQIFVGKCASPSGNFHAFYGSRQEGLVDIHALATSMTNSSALAISDEDWILVQAFDSRNAEVIWYHPQKGKGPAFSWNWYLQRVVAIPSSNRFAVVGTPISSPWFDIMERQYQVRNLILEPGKKPVLFDPKPLSGKTWRLLGIDNNGNIYGNVLDRDPSKRELEFFYQGILLRPIRPEDAGKK